MLTFHLNFFYYLIGVLTLRDLHWHFFYFFFFFFLFVVHLVKIVWIEYRNIAQVAKISVMKKVGGHWEELKISNRSIKFFFFFTRIQLIVPFTNNSRCLTFLTLSSFQYTASGQLCVWTCPAFPVDLILGEHQTQGDDTMLVSIFHSLFCFYKN